MDIVIRVQILDKVVCILHSINILGILSPAMVGLTELFNLVMATGQICIQTC